MRRLLLLAIFSVGAALIFASSLAYFDFSTLPPLAFEKIPLRFPTLWLWSVRIHVAAALVSFPLCIVLMTRAVQRRAALHRWLGRIAGTVMLFALVPTGAVLAFDAKGGAPSTVGFLLSGALIAWFLVRGVLAARRRDLAAHRHAMNHVFAQMSVAVTSRVMLVGFAMTSLAPDTAYLVALWLPVLGGVVVVEARSIRRKGHDLVQALRGVSVRSLSRSAARVSR